MITIRSFPRVRQWAAYSAWRTMLTILGSLLAGGVSTADEKASHPSLKEIVAVMKQRAEAIESLFVEYEVDSQLLDQPEAVKRYLHVGALLKAEHRTYAFKGVKQYYQLLRTKELEPLAPDVEPDFSAIPGGLELKKKLDAQIALTGGAGGAGGGASKRTAIEAKIGRSLNFSQESAFDGETLRRTFFGSTNATVTKREQIPPGIALFVQDYVRNIALKVPDALKSYNNTAWERLPDALEEDGYEVQAGEEQIYGASCIVVSRPGRDKLWLDPRLGYAPRQREIFDKESGLLRERLQNQNYIEVKPGTWLPRTCIDDECGFAQAPPLYRGKPLIRYLYTVKRLNLNNVPDELFVLQIKPGTVVADQTVRPENDKRSDYPVVYTMPANVRQLDVVVQAALEKEKEWDSARGRRYLVVSISVGILVLLVVLYVIRRYRWKSV